MDQVEVQRHWEFVLKRTIIIRDRDLGPLMYKSIKRELYDHIDVEPLTYKELQQENLIATLIDKPVPPMRTLPDIGVELLFREHSLYDKRYLTWYLTMDYPDGQIYVQSKADQPHDPLLRVTFEKDLSAAD
jgi:hypothetical protein